MKVVYCAINNRFSQTNPSVRSLALYAAEHLYQLAEESGGIAASIKAPFEFNQLIREYPMTKPVDGIARDLFRCGGDLYAFSCYIWNRRIMMDVIAQLRRMMPNIRIAAGGPEVSFNAPAILTAMPEIDYILCGESEFTWTRLLFSLINPAALSANLAAVPSLTWRDQNVIRSNAPFEGPIDLATLLFPYEWDLESLTDRMLYYESSRGCPFRCAYCLSGIDHRMRYRPLDQTLQHLDRFLDANARLVKFVDRTFNSDPQRARAIWSHLIQRRQDRPTRTCFHFEIAADLLTDEDIDLLSTAPQGLFQLEIGVQSIHPDTLARINRHCDLSLLYKRVRQLQQIGRQHLHLDLIAGLPGENLEQIILTFNQLYSLKADQLQLGFLKLLPGTTILQEIIPCSYTSQPFPPYEVLSSSALPADAFCRLHDVEAVLEMFANSGLFRHTLPHLISHFDSPYLFFLALATDLDQSGDTSRGLSIDERALILSCFADKRLSKDESRHIEGLLRLDHYCIGRKDAPSHLHSLETTATPVQKTRIVELRRNFQPGTRIRAESYPFSVTAILEEGRLTAEETWVVYDISGPDAVMLSVLPSSSIV